MIKPRTLLHLLRAKVYITKTCFKLFILLDLHFNFLKPCLFCFYFIVFNFLGQKKVTISLKYFFCTFLEDIVDEKKKDVILEIYGFGFFCMFVTTAAPWLFWNKLSTKTLNAPKCTKLVPLSFSLYISWKKFGH